jgi:hypothetical protein
MATTADGRQRSHPPAEDLIWDLSRLPLPADQSATDAADDQPATIGLGFTRPWGGSVFEGVVYESGYLALYDCSRPTEFVQFVEDEILPYCSTPESAEQVLLGDHGEDGEEDGPDTCEECGRESDTMEDGLCIVCRDKREEEAGTSIEDLDTVTETGGDE